MTTESAPSLSELRNQVDTIDGQLVALLGQRFAVTRQIGVLKAVDDLPSRDEARESHMHLRLAILAEEQGIDSAMVLRVFDEVIKRVREEHETIRRGAQ